MLSVSDPRSSRNRSSSRTRERSRSREPPARAASPPRRSKQAHHSDDDSDMVLQEEDSDDYRPSDRRRGGERERERERGGYEVAVRKKGDRERPEYERHGSGSNAGYERRDKERDRDERSSSYAVPGAYGGHDSHGYGDRDKGGEFHRELPDQRRSSYYASTSYRDDKDEALYRTKSGPGHDNKMQYAAPSKYEYAKPPGEVRYTSKAETSGPRYMAKEAAEIEVERRRHRREDEEERERRELEEELKHRRKVAVERERDRDRDRDGRKYRRDDGDSEEEERERRRRKKYEEEERERRRHIEADQHKRERRPSHSRPEAQVLEIHPGGRGGSSLKPLEHGVRRLSVSGGAGAGALLGAGLGAAHHHHSGAPPPGSPLLEAYTGTYQSISPMPSPMALPSSMDDGMSDLEPLEPEYGSDDSHHQRPKKSVLKKRVVIYDPEPDARAIAAELKRQKPEAKPLIKILPHLSDDNMMALRTEYKKHFKVQGKGINIAKHIKVKYTGNIGKVAYATALGRWESEAHWANFWYQSGSSRRELLIESLMGRSNLEIRQIKEAFSDKRYNDSLEKCMQTELKKDKFRHAVLLALEEKRGDDMAALSRTRVREDVENLYKALVAKDGGETAMIDIIVVRSDVHLREVLKEFETKYRRNFAREMIQKSQNLVVSFFFFVSAISFLLKEFVLLNVLQGETLAHILNGVINRPVRDALLLHQALAETSKDRAELLMSRLIRYHWEPKHLERIKVEYKKRYGSRVEVDVEEGTKGEFGEFCLALCQGATR